MFPFLLLLVTVATGTEVDNFTSRYQPLEDSSTTLNKSVNHTIEMAMQASNLDYSCNEANLYRHMKRRFNLFGWSKFEIQVVLNQAIPKHKIPKITIFEYFPFCGVKLPFTIAPVVRVGQVKVGADKFSHFFNEGWNYFKLSEIQGKGIRVALESGERDERGFWGVMTTGVYSYADLVANYQGYFFWKDLVRSSRPILKCLNSKWKIVRAFDWSDYIDSAFDESYNCSSFRTQAMEVAFTKRLHELELITKRKMNCPISQDVCKGLTTKYGKLAPMLLHPLCNKDNKYPVDRSVYVYRRIH